MLVSSFILLWRLLAKCMCDSYHKYVMKVVNHVQESDEGTTDGRIVIYVPFVDEETKWSTVAQIMPFEVTHDKSEPAIFVVQGRTEK